MTRSKKFKHSPGWYSSYLVLAKGEELALDYRGLNDSDKRKAQTKIRRQLHKVIDETHPMLAPVNPEQLYDVAGFDVPITLSCIPMCSALTLLGFETCVGKETLSSRDVEVAAQIIKQGYTERLTFLSNQEWAQGTEEKKRQLPLQQAQKALEDLSKDISSIQSLLKTRKKAFPFDDLRKKFNDLKGRVLHEISCSLLRAEKCREELDHTSVMTELKHEETRCLLYLTLKATLVSMRKFAWKKYCHEGVHVRSLFPHTVCEMKDLGITILPEQRIYFPANITPPRSTGAIPKTSTPSFAQQRTLSNSASSGSTSNGNNTVMHKNSHSALSTSPVVARDNDILNLSITSQHLDMPGEPRCSLCITSLCNIDDANHANEQCPHDHKMVQEHQPNLVKTYRDAEMLKILNKILNPEKKGCAQCKVTFIQTRHSNVCDADVYNFRPCQVHKKEIIKIQRFKDIKYNLHNCPDSFLVMDSEFCETCDACKKLNHLVENKSIFATALKTFKKALKKPSTPHKTSSLKKAKAEDNVILSKLPTDDVLPSPTAPPLSEDGAESTVVLDENYQQEKASLALIENKANDIGSHLQSANGENKNEVIKIQNNQVDQYKQQVQDQLDTNRQHVAQAVARDHVDSAHSSINNVNYNTVHSKFSNSKLTSTRSERKGSEEDEEDDEGSDHQQSNGHGQGGPPGPPDGGGGDDPSDPGRGGGGGRDDRSRRPHRRRDRGNQRRAGRRRQDGGGSPGGGSSGSSTSSSSSSSSSSRSRSRSRSRGRRVAVVNNLPLLHLKTDGCPDFHGNLYLYPQWRKFVDSIIAHNGKKYSNIRLHQQLLMVLKDQAYQLVSSIPMDHKKSAYEVLDRLEQEFDRPWMIFRLESEKMKQIPLPPYWIRSEQDLSVAKKFLYHLERLKAIVQRTTTHMDIENQILSYLLAKLHLKYKMIWYDKNEQMAEAHHQQYVGLPFALKRANMKFPQERLQAIVEVISRHIERSKEIVDSGTNGCLSEQKIVESAREALKIESRIGKTTDQVQKPFLKVVKTNTNPRNAFKTNLISPRGLQTNQQSRVAGSTRNVVNSTNPRTGYTPAYKPNQAKPLPKSGNFGQSSDNKKCHFCGQLGSHWMNQCENPLKKSPNELLKIAVRNQKCLNCLGKDPHRAFECSKPPCGQSGCIQRHHKLLHGADFSKLNEIYQAEVARAQKYGGPLQKTGNGKVRPVYYTTQEISQLVCQDQVEHSHRTQLSSKQQQPTNKSGFRGRSSSRGRFKKFRGKGKGPQGRARSTSKSGMARMSQIPTDSSSPKDFA